MYRLDEGERGDRAPRRQNRGLAYWSDGKADTRLLLITPGYQLVALDAKTGKAVWNLNLVNFGQTAPMTYMVGGKQYIALQGGSSVVAYMLF